MKILILGGTIFLGKHLVKSALKLGHQITLFNRGKHKLQLSFVEAEHVQTLLGDRNGDFESLKGKTFDAVIDTCGYVPRIVKMSGEFLKEAVKHYIFISSISVYDEPFVNGMDENHKTGKLKDETVEEITDETYGPLKYLCERAVQDVYKDNALIIRPGLIVGEDDPSDRFTYWIHRVNEGGKVLAPDIRKRNVQFINVKDLADWIIKMIEEKISGVFNATGPDYELKFEKFITECKKVSLSNSEIEWADEKFLIEENVMPFTELTLWVPQDAEGMNNVNISKAISNGLTFRTLTETLEDTLRFDKSRKNYTLRAGLSPEREKELLNKWEACKRKSNI